ncbi:MAG: DMT family transporter [Acidobacteriota bacterium]|nr:DMT family transporter [Acidobacteriota bacterium]MDH3528322.1 DMT family transporter [Acidobacteriota bacterium]
MKVAFGTYFFIVLALLAGMMMPTQAAINNRLSTFVDNPVLAAFVSFVIGTIALFVYILMAGIPLGNLASLRQATLISWTGGVLGAFFVASAVILVPRLGVALTFSLIVAGQMVITLVLDHYGFLGVPVKEISLYRLAGVALIVSGVVLIRKF